MQSFSLLALKLWILERRTHSFGGSMFIKLNESSMRIKRRLSLLDHLRTIPFPIPYSINRIQSRKAEAERIERERESASLLPCLKCKEYFLIVGRNDPPQWYHCHSWLHHWFRNLCLTHWRLDLHGFSQFIFGCMVHMWDFHHVWRLLLRRVRLYDSQIRR